MNWSIVFIEWPLDEISDMAVIVTIRYANYRQSLRRRCFVVFLSFGDNVTSFERGGLVGC